MAGQTKIIFSIYVRGAEVGHNIKFFDTKNILVDMTRPWLLHIGDYSKITRGVISLTHDYSLDVLRRVYGEWIGEGKTTWIGENCFIGMNSIILMGSHIGDNVIVGAGSVVHGEVPDNVVVAGNPAKVICTLEEHYYNRKEATIKEALHCAKRYYDVKGELPTEHDVANFYSLFLQRDEQSVSRAGVSFKASGDEEDKVKAAFYNSEPLWNGYEEYMKKAGLDLPES